MVPRHPEELNPHPWTPDLGTLTRVLLIMLVWIPVAAGAVLLTMRVLLVCKAFRNQYSPHVAFRASLCVFVPLYRLPFFLSSSGNLAAITGICLDGLILILGILAAIRVVRHARTS
jgi:hypothetical protein